MEPKALAAVQALLLNQGPPKTSDIPWVALIGQSVSIASAQSGTGTSESSLETAWRAETESLKSILTGAPQSKLGRIALVESLAGQIRNRMKLRLPTLLTGYLFLAILCFLLFGELFVVYIIFYIKKIVCCEYPHSFFRTADSKFSV